MGFMLFLVEDVGVLIEEFLFDFYLFLFDYLYVEGGCDLIGKFEQFIGDMSEGIKIQFYIENFLCFWLEVCVYV